MFRVAFLKWILLAIPAFVLFASSVVGKELDRVAVVLSHPARSMNVASVEFYRSVLDAIEQQGQWQPLSMATVKRQIPRKRQLSFLGAIPAIDRRTLLKSHPSVNGETRTQGAGKRSRQPAMIPLVQRMLDTLALDGAVLVDCKPARRGTVKACGTYYYDRAKAMVLAQSRKEFAVGIKDASRWASPMVAALGTGMRRVDRRQNMQQVEQAMKSQEGGKASAIPTIEVRGVGMGFDGPARSVGNLPMAEVVVGTEGSSYGFGVGVGYGMAANHDGTSQHDLTDRSVFLQFGARSRALESLIWDLNLGIGYAERFLQTDAASKDDAPVLSGRLESKGLRLSVGPGLMWQVGDHVSFGGSVAYKKDLPFVTKSDGRYAGENLDDAAFSAGLRLKTTF